MPDVVAVVHRWHDDVLDLVAELDRLPNLGEWPTGEQVRRGISALHRLRRVACSQETAKERVLWPLVRQHVQYGEGLARTGLAQKRHLEQLLLKMQWVDDRTHAMDELLRELLGCMREHLRFERGVLGAVEMLDPDLVAEAGGRLLHVASASPTRPHPDLPSSPRLAVVLAPLLSRIDRMRDRLSPAPSGE